MADTDEASSTPRKIVLHEKAFAHLTRGMYRSPASAIRELVSNAWDAQARNVQIRTGYPHFVQLSITDDGDGFDEDEFLRIVEGGLGNSEKRVHGPMHGGRPLIGRLGVGMFGIAQICGSFIVSSNPRSGSPFKARIALYNLLKEELDKAESTLVRRLGEEGILEVDIGEFTMLTFDPDEFDGFGTRIVADVMHPVFSRTFRDAIALKDGVPNRDWKTAITKQAAKHHSLQELGEYFRLMWEIAASVPVPYFDDRAVPDNCIATYQRELVKEKFRVFVDGIELRKPVWLRGNPNGYSTIAVPQASEKVYNRTISFSGYVAVQEGRQLQPDELRGILIRVKGVGIGLYDPSLLDYRFNEGPRSRWVTGEIYVSDGLENALNVDRDSFNRFHPQYKFLQSAVHKVLRERLFPAVYVKIDQRSTSKAKAKEVARSEALSATLQNSFSAKTRKTAASASGGSSLSVRSIKINNVERSVEVKMEKPESLDTKKANRQLASSILTIFDLALLQRSKDKMRSTFLDALLKLLKEW